MLLTESQFTVGLHEKYFSLIKFRITIVFVFNKFLF